MIINIKVLGPVILSMAVFVSGCGNSFFTSRRDNPVIEDYVGGIISGEERVGFMATTASHRLVTVRLTTGQGGVGRTGMLCPEPPPDVARAVSDSFAAAVEAAVDTPEGSANVEANSAIVSTFASAITPLLRRSQGLQFYRDGMYYLCVAYINEAIQRPQYEAQADAIRQMALTLMEREAANPPPFIPITVSASNPEEAAAQIITRLRELLQTPDTEPDGDDGVQSQTEN